ncbi:MAG: pyridoxamine 5'-phosphate oxidase family protein [Anaerolineales bacterium]|nr:pyridoxamine 5'-phosphate oxidase family protein [Anaerolineales bacterium]
MNTQKPGLDTFSESDIRSFEPEMKIGLLATVNPDGLPHLTLISSLRANSPTTMTWGQFTEGMSKQFIRQNPRTGFLIMSLNKEVWRGKATFTGTCRSGPDYDFYNNQPMFRYNSYFGIHTVYNMDLAEHTGREELPMGRIILGAVQGMAAAALSRRGTTKPVLNAFTRGMLDKPGNLKFLAVVEDDGYPYIIPVLQAHSAGSDRILFPLTAYGDELRGLKPSPAAFFSMSLSMEDVALRGEFLGFRRVGGIKCGEIRVNWVYNSMPPVPGQVYPPVEIQQVTDFNV